MIGVLTYNVKHRKTYDVLCLLKAKGYESIHVFAVPLHYTKKFRPLIEHRPPISINIPDLKDICRNFKYNYHEGQIDSFNIPTDTILLVCGAGILPKEFVEKYKIINAHPGYIPNCRGLDALKWAIYEGHPIGITTHLLGEYVDAGEVIERRIIPVQYNDTFHALSQRVYENEIGMLVEAIEQLKHGTTFIDPEDYPLHKRMPHEYEMSLLDKFEKLKGDVPIG